ncbi:uncharacterized protein LOC143298199 [Babylonia areolata]|uniref:uncharacterized protein LOC143298199 n=1 Tax=Babylonia areolata TaxID=304850 RepID=UPI003FD180B5
MTLLAVGSISRLGAIRNMTVEQLHNAKTVEEDENLYRIDVTTHKTMKIYGAAGIYLSKDLKPHLQRYLDERPADSPWVFCTSTGKQISSSHAAYVFRKMTHTTATQMRKSVAVAHRESPAEVQNAISEAMLHSLIVHKESYAGKTHHSTVYKGLRAVGVGRRRGARAVGIKPVLLNGRPARAVGTKPVLLNGRPARAVRTKPVLLNGRPARAVRTKPVLLNGRPARAVRTKPVLLNGRPARAVRTKPVLLNGRPARALADACPTSAGIRSKTVTRSGVEIHGDTSQISKTFKTSLC